MLDVKNNDKEGTTIEELGHVLFGLLRWRFWKHYDNLVVVGFNKGRGEYFILGPKRTKELVRSMLTSADKTPPKYMAQNLFKVYDPKNYLEASFYDKGSIKVSDTAISFRHFVFVSLLGIEDEMKVALDYKVLDLSRDLVEQVGQFHADFIRRVITDYQKRLSI